MDIDSSSGALYDVGMANLHCMGLFWAGLSLSPDSIHRSLATSQGSIQSDQQPPLSNR